MQPSPSLGAHLPPVHSWPALQVHTPLRSQGVQLGSWTHSALHCPAAPVSTWQALIAAQEAAEGQLPSHVSLPSTTPFPQEAEQSESLSEVQPAGQHPSPLLQALTVVYVHVTLQLPALPVSVSVVHELPSSHEPGQLPSHDSPLSWTAFPQTGLQSESVSDVQPAGQQPSELSEHVLATLAQTRSQVAADPVLLSVVQTLPSSQLAGQLPSHSSPDSVMPLPQEGEQSGSLFALQPGAQQPSARHAVTAVLVHNALQLVGLPE